MSRSEVAQPQTREPLAPWRLAAVLALATAALAWHTLAMQHLPPGQWMAALFHPAAGQLRQLVVHYAWLPRLCLSLLAGGGLALAGVVFQQVLRNPLAEPLTLGVAGGSSLALMLSAIWAPALALRMPFGIALAGAGAAMLATLALTWRKGFTPVPMVLAGMIVNLYCSALGLVLTVLYERSLTSIFIWGGGSLVQNDWQGVLWLLPRLAVGALGAALLLRPLGLFALDDRSAGQLGLSLFWSRLLALVVAVALSACIVSTAGVIGFIGLAAPALLRLAGARRLRQRLLWALPIGALLLAFTDQLVQCLPGILGELLPTGAVVALLGGPLLLWLLFRMPVANRRPVAERSEPRPRRSWQWIAILLAGLLALGFIVALYFANTLQGWHWALGAARFWRLPGLLAALLAGVMLAWSGVLLQRISGNPLASPELLGVSGGGMLGIACAILLLHIATTSGVLLASLTGSAFSLLAILALGRRGRFAPGQVLIAGVAISAFAQSILALGMAGGGAYASALREIMLGSTYLVTPGVTLACVVWMAVLGCGAWLCGRWLDLLPLGADVAESLGMNVRRSRLVLLLLSAALAAGATIVAGPLSFVGLLAPQMARLLGCVRARPQLLVAALLGALLMVLANWLQRNLFFPQQVPAGILATLLGGPCLMWLLRR